jgi:hypothetical protein
MTGPFAGFRPFCSMRTNAQPGRKAGGTERHRFGPAKPGREHVHPGRGNTRALGIAAMMGDANVVTGCEDFITRLEPGIAACGNPPGQIDASDAGETPDDASRRQSRPMHPCS